MEQERLECVELVGVVVQFEIIACVEEKDGWRCDDVMFLCCERC